MSGTDGRRRGAAGRSHATSQRVPTENGTINGENGGIGVPPWQGGNRILASLAPDELSVIGASLTAVALGMGRVLYDQRAVIDSVYFPLTAGVSPPSRMETETCWDAGTYGNEGAVWP